MLIRRLELTQPTCPAGRAAPRGRRLAAAVLGIALAACGGDKTSSAPLPDGPAAATSAAVRASADEARVAAAQTAADPVTPEAAAKAAERVDKAPEPIAKVPEVAAKSPGTAKPSEATMSAPQAAAKAPEAAAKAPQGAAKAPEAAAKAKAAPRGGAGALPKAPDGILSPAEADRILKPGAPSSVSLLDGGALPRETLVYAFGAGKQALGMKLDMSMALSMGTTKLPQTSMPRIVMLLDLGAAGGASGARDTQVDGLIHGVRLEPSGPVQQKVADLMQPQLDAMRGLGIRYAVTPRGRVHDVSMKLPPGLPENAQQMLTGMSQSFESLTAPLPEEPVGTGARWQVVTRMASSGVDIVQFATYTLRSRDGHKIALDLDMVQLAATASIAPPGMPEGVTARLKAFRSSGSGSTRIDMTSVAPEGGRLDMSTAMTLGIAGAAPGGAVQDSNVQMTMALGVYRPAK